MKNKNVKVIDEHNIDRDANVMFALELEGSEYVVYWIERDEESNNLFVSKVLKNIDGTYNMLNIDDDDKKREVADLVKTLISNSVTDQNDKMVGTTTTLSNGKVVKFVNVSFNKEQQINVAKTYITTVKKEVTKVSETYYDVVVEEAKVADVLPAAPVEPVQAIFPELSAPVVEAPVTPQPAPAVVEPITAPQPTVIPTPVVEPKPVVMASPEVTLATPVQPSVVETPVIPQPAPVVVEPVVAVQPEVVSTSTVVTPTPVNVTSDPIIPAPVVSEPIASVVETPTVVQPVSAQIAETPQVIPPVAEPATVVETSNQPLVFNAAKETNLNAALGEVANSTTIPVENIEPIREFGVESPVVQSTPVQPTAPVNQTVEATSSTVAETPSSPKSGFANSKFFMVVAIAFFLASCVFLGYEVYNYFQLVK